jgi:hypothetical protein
MSGCQYLSRRSTRRSAYVSRRLGNSGARQAGPSRQAAYAEARATPTAPRPKQSLVYVPVGYLYDGGGAGPAHCLSPRRHRRGDRIARCRFNSWRHVSRPLLCPCPSTCHAPHAGCFVGGPAIRDQHNWHWPRPICRRNFKRWIGRAICFGIVALRSLHRHLREPLGNDTLDDRGENSEE